MLIPNRNNGYPFAFFRSDFQKRCHDLAVLQCMTELANNLNDRALRNDFLQLIGKVYPRKRQGDPGPHAIHSLLIRCLVRMRGGKLIWEQRDGRWSLTKGGLALAWLIPNGNEFITDIHPAFFDNGYSCVDIDTPEEGEQFLRQWAMEGVR